MFCFKLAMFIMGSVLIIVGVVKNVIPVKFNEGIFGKIEGEAENFAAAMRTNLVDVEVQRARCESYYFILGQHLQTIKN